MRRGVWRSRLTSDLVEQTGYGAGRPLRGCGV